MLLNESKTLTALYDILGHRQGKTDQIIGSFSRHVEQGLGIEKNRYLQLAMLGHFLFWSIKMRNLFLFD